MCVCTVERCEGDREWRCGVSGRVGEEEREQNQQGIGECVVEKKEVKEEEEEEESRKEKEK